MRSLFLYDPSDLKEGYEGGVQICTREFLDVVREASDSVHLFQVNVARDLKTRARRALRLGSYLLYRPEVHLEDLAQLIIRERIDVIFINRAELLRFSSAIKFKVPDVKVILMSHGNQSGDDLYEVAGAGGRRTHGLKSGIAMWDIGRDLVLESRYRHQYLDGVCVMTGEEEVLERWMGARATTVIPRLIKYAPLKWTPVNRRVGFVGTLDHTPNRVALEAVLEHFSRIRPPEDFEIRLVGRPSRLGVEFAERYSFVTYCGGLSDEDLRAEAMTWSLFLNPIMWLSLVASMKLGQALGWGLPVVTTRSGRRGYEWKEGDVPTSDDDASRFTEATLHIIQERSRVCAVRDESIHAAQTSPTLDELGVRVTAMITGR